MLRGELFSTEMVRAYQLGRKLHTARPIKPQPPEMTTAYFERGGEHVPCFVMPDNTGMPLEDSVKPKHRPGDYIYCRETFGYQVRHGGRFMAFKVDNENEMNYDVGANGSYPTTKVKWRPSIHMPREAARLFFRVSKVEVMRLEDVTEEFAQEDGFEGVDLIPARNPEDAAQVISAKQQFEAFWRSTYGDARWMWVYWTEPCSKEEAEGGAG